METPLAEATESRDSRRQSPHSTQLGRANHNIYGISGGKIEWQDQFLSLRSNFLENEVGETSVVSFLFFSSAEDFFIPFPPV